MTVSYETLLNIARWIGLAFLVATIVWQIESHASKASQIADVLGAAFLTVVETGILVNNIVNDKSWGAQVFFMLLWLFNVVFKAVLEILRKGD